MFGMKQAGVNAYANVGLETGVVDASPIRVIVMLYDGAISACIQAQQALQQRDYGKKGEALVRAINIIDKGLRAALDRQQGGQIADNLDQLYQYMVHGLLHANLHLDAEKMHEVQLLLTELRGAWVSLEAAGVSKPDHTLAGMMGQVPAAQAMQRYAAGV